jgi:hypothetical protein
MMSEREVEVLGFVVFLLALVIAAAWWARE